MGLTGLTENTKMQLGWCVLIAIKLGIQNKGFTKLSATRTGGTLRKKPQFFFQKTLVHLTETDMAQPTVNMAHPGIIKNEFAHSVITKNSTWIIDTGASHHMTRDSDNLICHKSFFPERYIHC